MENNVKDIIKMEIKIVKQRKGKCKIIRKKSDLPTP